MCLSITALASPSPMTCFHPLCFGQRLRFMLFNQPSALLQWKLSLLRNSHSCCFTNISPSHRQFGDAVSPLCNAPNHSIGSSSGLPHALIPSSDMRSAIWLQSDTQRLPSQAIKPCHATSPRGTALLRLSLMVGLGMSNLHRETARCSPVISSFVVADLM